MRLGSVPPRVRSAVRPLLPLPQLPAADRKRLRHQPADRDRSRGAARGRPGTGRRAPRRQDDPADLPLPELPGCGLQSLYASWHAIRPRRYARRPVEHFSGRPHLHPVEASLGHASGVRACVLDVLRPEEALAAREPRTGCGAQKTDRGYLDRTIPAAAIFATAARASSPSRMAEPKPECSAGLPRVSVASAAAGGLGRSARRREKARRRRRRDSTATCRVTGLLRDKQHEPLATTECGCCANGRIEGCASCWLRCVPPATYKSRAGRGYASWLRTTAARRA